MDLNSWEKGNALKMLEERWMNILRNMFSKHWKEARVLDDSNFK